ncbi:MAG: 2Fe-2S iron-sulfur cluster binding domain-containing protein [Chloroflexi bacterium]|nr:MAG: 2Fe-2S iron-sulfur cluster binding domain-containing protein [Chloroflexota bacterium]
MPDINLTIDGHKLTVPAGTLIVEAAKTVGIEIPVFCYHHKLDPVGACRLCLVDFSPGPPRPQTACTTPVSEGMVVRTQSSMAVQARADILEFELANHPLDCPVCDKGGECPLQDFTFRHGYPTSRIDGPRLHFKKPIPLSDKIALDRERCVLCYRCTRYYDEIAWEQELTTDERGVQSFITSQFEAVGHDTHCDHLLKVLCGLQRDAVAAPRTAGPGYVPRERRDRRGLDLRPRSLRLHRRQRPCPVAHADHPGHKVDMVRCHHRGGGGDQGQRGEARRLASAGHHQ